MTFLRNQGYKIGSNKENRFFREYYNLEINPVKQKAKREKANFNVVILSLIAPLNSFSLSAKQIFLLISIFLRDVDKFIYEKHLKRYMR